MKMIQIRGNITDKEYIKALKKYGLSMTKTLYISKFWKCTQCGRVNEEIYIYCNECGHIETLD